ncbi:MAG: hypothetical protein GC204_13760 [Chloroflexi bacterium]|nr:hypothetical protein [Chloroflexota bacterium]
MSGLRLRETFNRLLKTQFAQYLKKGAIATLVAASVVTPALAHHNDNSDLNTYNSNTRHSQELRHIQNEFNNAVRDRRMILVDPDWVQINRALNNVQDEKLRNRYITEYLLESGRLHLNQDYFKGQKDAEWKDPHTERFGVTTAQGQSMQVCIIFGGRGESDIKTRVRDFINVSKALHGKDVADADVKVTTDTATFKKFVNFHEIGHCMDDWYLPNMNSAKASSAQSYLMYYHKAETFGDVFSVLMMARDEGVTNIAETIADIRLANMALAGPFQVEWARQGSTSYYASFIYATHRSIRAAQDYIDQNGTTSLQMMSYKQIAQLASNIVDQNALNKNEYEALMALYATKFNLNVWNSLKGSMPYIAQHYNDAIKLRQEIAQGLIRVLDLKLKLGQDPLDVVTANLATVTPSAYINELKQKQGNPAVLDARAQALGNRLYQQAGGTNASINSLLQIFTLQKDIWRATLSGGTDAQRAQAMDDLSVAGKAVWYAAQKISGPAPANTNTAPAQQPPKAAP